MKATIVHIHHTEGELKAKETNMDEYEAEP